MSVTSILDAWSASEEPDLAALGGEAAILADADALVVGPHLSTVVTVLCDSWATLVDPTSVARFVLRGVAETQRLLDLEDSLDVLLDRPQVLPQLGPELGSLLLERTRDRVGGAQPALAAAALAGALRLELGAWTKQRMAIAAVMASISGSEEELFAVPAARLLSIAYEMWRFPELRDALARLEATSAAAQDARHEYAITELADALDATDRDELLTGLGRAAALFGRAGREDSVVYQIGISAVRAYAEEGSASLSPLANELLERVRKRSMGFHGIHATWLTPRIDAEHEWLRLVWLLNGAQENGDALSPEAVAAQLFEAYAASRTVRLISQGISGEGVATIVEPRIESCLLRDADTRRALIALLDSGATADDQLPAVTRLRAALLSGKKKTKSWSSLAIPS